MKALIFGDKGYIANSIFFDKVKSFEAILLDKKTINQKKKFNKKVDLIIHTLGANKFISKKNKNSTLKSKQQITLDLVNFAKRNKIKKIVYISSTNIYKNNKKKFNLEDPYISAHIVAENILKKYANSNLKIMILRTSHFFGLRDTIKSKGKFLSVGNQFIKYAFRRKKFILKNNNAKINILPFNYFINKISKLLFFKSFFVKKDILFLEIRLDIFLKYLSDFVTLKTSLSPIIYLDSGKILQLKKTKFFDKMNKKKKSYLDKEIEYSINFFKKHYL